MQKGDSRLKASWLIPPDILELQPHQVDIWRIDLSHSIGSLEILKKTLSTDESQRAARFHFREDKDRFVAAHGSLRDILSRYLYCEPKQLRFSTNAYGKPALLDHELEFNLSHSGNFVLAAITLERKVGIDVEQIRPEISSQSIARHYFSPAEVAELFALSTEQWEIGFFGCWTRKEAYIKAQGLGLSLPLVSFDVSLNPGEPARLRATRPDPQEAERWTLISLETDPQYASAVAIEDQNVEFRFWDWN